MRYGLLMNSARPVTVPLHVAGIAYDVALSPAPDGGTRWSTKTSFSELAGTAFSLVEALREARDSLQCSPIWLDAQAAEDRHEASEEEIEVLLEGLRQSDPPADLRETIRCGAVGGSVRRAS